MSCSILNRVKTDLRRNNLVNSNMEAPLSKEREVTNYVLDLTRIAKSKYKVNIGNIFSIQKNKKNITLIPNIPAFDAIERSKEYIQAQIMEKVNQNQRTKDESDVEETEVTSEVKPDIIQPKGLPIIEITC